MPSAVAQLPQRQRRVALAGVIKPEYRAVTAPVSEGELERLLSGGRAVGRARVVYPPQFNDDVLEAVLAGLRAL
ncbi:hypothetical protein QTQ03_24280 [Micromonospora sp. WMMA1363]|uniref:hypothetical protein n=1 Tax=Micromonospora sp. WMMA1363 TaxID=3053985 RepID=UPI00259C9B77|nr:hypothetical protein [Micromonospora sp. WMMA1363]MDM4722555.1 hypothetical protein [Micromonospora sp. WMMA1363]